MRPGDDVKPVLDKIKDTYARMAAAGSSVSQLQQCTKIISVRPEGWAPPGMKPPSGERVQVWVYPLKSKGEVAAAVLKEWMPRAQRECEHKEVRLEIVKTHQQAADIFTKRLAEADHWKGMKLAGMSVP
ncbi:hypothetical protein CLOM_g20668 [Closterium sp. NIES-68]|nr:hypothetical protein CLOM_g20668 [Closterium sp. NIES-68]